MPVVTHEDLEYLRPVLEPLPNGHYAASDLYLRHKMVMHNAGREPWHPVRFGQVMKHYGAMRKAKWDKARKTMVKGWVI